MKNNTSLFCKFFCLSSKSIPKTHRVVLTLFFSLALFSPGHSQITYTDYTPDAELISRDSLPIDLNNDDINDFVLYYRFLDDGFSWSYRYWIRSINDAQVAITNDSATAIPYGENINEALNWSANSQTYIQYTRLSSSHQFQGHWRYVREAYLGLRIKLDDEYHYAWLRLHLSGDHTMWAVDYAFNETPTSEIITGEGADLACTSLDAIDVNNYFDGRDIQFSFTKAIDETLFSEYRVILAKADDNTALDINVMNQLEEDKYYSIPVDISDTNFVIRDVFMETSTDKDGDVLEKFLDYRVHILNISEDGNSDLNRLATPSKPIKLSAYIEAVKLPLALDKGSNNQSSDIEISFDSYISEDYLTEFRAFVIPFEDIGNFDAEQAWLLPNDFYTLIPIDEDSMVILNLNENQKDIAGDFITSDVAYQVRILSVPDSISCRTPVFSEPSRRFYLTEPNSFYAGQKEGENIHWFECDDEFSPFPYINGDNPNHDWEEYEIDLNRDGQNDISVNGGYAWTSGGSFSQYYIFDPLGDNQVLICDHVEHDDWIDVLSEPDAISAEYNWYNEAAILKQYHSSIGGVSYDNGHLISYHFLHDYYIGFMIKVDNQTQYAWLKLRGAQYLEYGFKSITTGTNEFNQQNKFDIYPNPATEHIQINYHSQNTNRQLSVSVINSMGIQIEEFKFQNQQLTKDISSYPAGLYFFEIRENDVVLETQKVIVQ